MTLFTLITPQLFTTGGGGLSTKKIAAARDPRLRSPSAAHARRQSSRPGACWARCWSSCWARCRARSWPCHLAQLPAPPVTVNERHREYPGAVFDRQPAPAGKFGEWPPKLHVRGHVELRHRFDLNLNDVVKFLWI